MYADNHNINIIRRIRTVRSQKFRMMTQNADFKHLKIEVIQEIKKRVASKVFQENQNMSISLSHSTGMNQLNPSSHQNMSISLNHSTGMNKPHK